MPGALGDTTFLATVCWALGDTTFLPTVCCALPVISRCMCTVLIVIHCIASVHCIASIHCCTLVSPPCYHWIGGSAIVFILASALAPDWSGPDSRSSDKIAYPVTANPPQSQL